MIHLPLASLLLATAPFVAESFPAGDVHQAARRGELDALLTAIEEHPELTGSLDPEGLTILHCAVAYDRRETVAALLEVAPQLLEVKDGAGLSPLNLAAARGRCEMAEILLDAGAEQKTGDHERSHPLINACAGGHVATAELLLERGAEVNYRDLHGTTAFHFAAARGRVELMARLEELGAEIDVANTLQGMTPLHWAAGEGGTAAVEFLLEREVNLEHRDLAGRTPLLLAVAGNQRESVIRFLEAGADVDAASAGGETPFLAACQRNVAMSRRLLEAGADPEASDDAGRTALHFAVIGGTLELLEDLIGFGLDPNQRAGDGRTPFAIAIDHDNLRFATALLERGGKVDVLDAHGNGLLHNSVIGGRAATSEFLLEAGVAVDLPDGRYGRTALHWAAVRGVSEWAGRLLDAGADVDAKDVEGNTPLMLASRYGNLTPAKLLLERGATETKTEASFGPHPLLASEPAAGEGYVWYLGHCGFAVKTKHHFLIFDYWESGAHPDEPRLANGHIDPKELDGQQVTVFVTHDHGDHLFAGIERWAQDFDDVQFVVGYAPPSRFAATAMLPHETREIRGMKVSTIQSNDAGVGFLVEVDGLRLYHAGDHAGWAPGARDGFTGEIDWLAKRVSSVDMTFVNVTGCHTNDPLALAEGNAYTVEKLSPKVVFPTHAADREYIYAGFAKDAMASGWKCAIGAPSTKGDWFHFRGGALQ